VGLALWYRIAEDWGALTAVKESLQIDKIRALVANHLDVDIKLVTDEAHFTEDLLELTMLIEDQFTGLEIADDDIDQIEIVGDLIRHIEHVCEPAINSRVAYVR
jgi:acyl carrier protein